MLVRPTKPVRSRALFCAALMLLLVFGALGAAGKAAAAPQGPILGLDGPGGLRAMLAASPTGVTATFKTVIKGGADPADIVDISCTLLGIVPDAAIDGGDLIFFKSGDAVIADAGGIVAGMSGSPVYVDVGGIEKLVGAVSYGDMFTKGGYGLATPIEHMMTLETDFTSAPAPAPSLRSVQTAGGTRHLLIAPTSAAAAKAKPAAGTLVMRPLGLFELGGIPAESNVYQMLAASMAKRGITLTHAVAGGTGTAPGYTGLVLPGASVGALFTRGDLWYGGIGTVTYLTDNDQLVAFGHPLGSIHGSYDEGATSLYMTYANVLGIWGSTYEPYKMVVPGDVSGEIVRDSGPGILGTIGGTPAEATFTSNATYAPSGVTKHSTVSAPQGVVDQAQNTDLTTSLVYPAMWWATGAYNFPGNIVYHLQLNVTDGTHEYTVDRTNEWDSQYDAASLALMETQLFYNSLLSNADGVAPCKIESVTVDSTLTPQHNSARILDVDCPGGLKVGANDVVVTVQRYGVTTPVVEHVSLVIPAGIDPTKGVLYASAPDLGVQDSPYGGYSYSNDYGPYYGGAAQPPQSLAEIVDGLNALPRATELQVAFDPSSTSDYYDYYGSGTWSPKAIVTSRDIDMVTQGTVYKRTSSIVLVASTRLAAHNGVAVLAGQLQGPVDDTTVAIYRQDLISGVRTLVDTVPATIDPESYTGNACTFYLPLTGLSTNSRYFAVWGGDSRTLSTSASVKILVRAGVSLRATTSARGAVGLAATLSPHQPSGAVMFQRLRNGSWVTLKTVALSGGASAQMTWKPRAGSYSVRAVFTGSGKNASGISAVRRVTVH
jgi:hypothetical protein